MIRTILVISLFITAFSSPATTVDECNAQNPNNCLNGVGPAVINPDNVRVTASQVSNRISNQSERDNEDIAFIGTSALKGLAAGDSFSGWGFWANYSLTNFEADMPINSVVQPIASYDANQDSVLVGVDTLLFENFVIGLALGYEDTDIDTAYNGGNNEIDGVTVAPYMAYFFNDIFSVDLAAGYTFLDNETDRIDNVSGGTILGEFDSDRWFIASNINAFITHGHWVIGGRAGVLYSEEEQDGYTETGPNTARTILDRHIDLFQTIVGVDLAYNFNRIEPYASFSYVNDFGRDNGIGSGGLPASVGATQPDDDDEIQADFGFRYYGDVFTGSLGWTRVIDRDTFDSNTILLTIRADL